MRYYSTQRPIAPGSFPKPPFNKVQEIHNFDSKTFCKEIGREAWGYIEYERLLNPMTAIDFELTPPPRKVKAMQSVGIDGWGREVYKDENGQCWKYTEPGEMPRERHDRLYSTDEPDGEPGFPMRPDIDYRIEEGV